MTDTTKAIKPRNVDYSLEIVDDLPENASNGQPRSVLETQLATIVRQFTEGVGVDEAGVGKWRRIGLYELNSAAAAAANVLRKRHGSKPVHSGWEFRTAKVQDGSAVTKTGLFARYNPQAIVEGEFAKHLAEVKAHEATLAAKKEAGKGTPEAPAGPPSAGNPPVPGKSARAS
jgi:hypothetical protein